jgi:ACR3 family arsenite transporter
MIFVWSHLLDGEPHFTLSQVALLLGLSSITVPWPILSMMLYIPVPVVVAQVWRRALLSGAHGDLTGTLRTLARWSLGVSLLP